MFFCQKFHLTDHCDSARIVRCKPVYSPFYVNVNTLPQRLLDCQLETDSPGAYPGSYTGGGAETARVHTSALFLKKVDPYFSRHPQSLS